jgi:hypothetical protein
MSIVFIKLLTFIWSLCKVAFYWADTNQNYIRQVTSSLDYQYHYLSKSIQ